MRPPLELQIRWIQPEVHVLIHKVSMDQGQGGMLVKDLSNQHVFIYTLSIIYKRSIYLTF